ATLVSRLNTWQGAQAEIWFTNSVQSPSYAPRRLQALNGYSLVGSTWTNYLPLRPRAFGTAPTNYSWTFHDSSAGATGWVYDKCGGSSPLIAATVNENKLNYIPTVAPQEAGGKYWVIFTSRRLYGNIATSSPWQAERSNDSSNYFGPFTAASCDSYDQYSPGSGLIETKKLWIAAVDKDWETTGATDPSHPAFYLPGQELKAGNSHGYWVANACAALGTSCTTNDDCCNGTGTSASAQCKVVDTSTVPATKVCSAVGSCSSSAESCDTNDDCCTGLTCPTGGGVCISVPPLAYHQQSLNREYDSACAQGLEPTWRFLEWQATIPTGTSIAFSIQAKRNASDPWSPSTPAAMSTATTTTPSGQWDPDITVTPTVGDILAATSPALQHAPYVRVTMTFNPDSTGANTPTLLNWRQVYDCMPAD
ncbi:MAG TPA: hypothetical protein VG963_23670, partial [Polyangiaceae bacterium]|nr:hypothetical protein [Polyangiaceae bacterium]